MTTGKPIGVPEKHAGTAGEISAFLAGYRVAYEEINGSEAEDAEPEVPTCPQCGSRLVESLGGSECPEHGLVD